VLQVCTCDGVEWFGIVLATGKLAANNSNGRSKHSYLGVTRPRHRLIVIVRLFDQLYSP